MPWFLVARTFDAGTIVGGARNSDSRFSDAAAAAAAAVPAEARDLDKPMIGDVTVARRVLRSLVSAWSLSVAPRGNCDAESSNYSVSKGTQVHRHPMHTTNVHNP